MYILANSKMFLTIYFQASGVCGKIFLSLGYLRLAERLAVVVIKAINLSKINNELPGACVIPLHF